MPDLTLAQVLCPPEEEGEGEVGVWCWNVNGQVMG